ncbi:MAG: glycosyltransferase [Bacteroidota bacterium]|nr:glycosyltransferase [Bacteroidota bacterium]
MAQIKAPTVLFLASWYPTPINKSHGIFIRNHAIALSKFSNVVVAYAYSDSNTLESKLHTTIVNENFTEYIVEYKKSNSSIPLISQLQKLLRFKSAYKSLLNVLQKKHLNVTAIQVNVVFPAAMCFSIFKNYYKVKHTIVEHWSGYLPEDGNYNGFFTKFYTKKVFKNASKIFYVSEKQKEAMRIHGLVGNYQLIYNVVDTTIFKINPNKKNPIPLFLHVSTLDKDQKNILGTLNTLKNLQNSSSSFQSIFVGGDLETKHYFEEKAKELSITNIDFVGHKTQIQIAELMQQAHALILFSNYENMPVVILEALACGLPIFASNVGQLPYFISDDFGILVDVGNEEQLTKHLQLFLEGKLKFDANKMNIFISEHATHEIVGRQLADEYLIS